MFFLWKFFIKKLLEIFERKYKILFIISVRCSIKLVLSEPSILLDALAFVLPDGEPVDNGWDVLLKVPGEVGEAFYAHV